MPKKELDLSDKNISGKVLYSIYTLKNGLVGIGSPDRPPSKQCGGWWVVGGGWWVKKKLVGRKILSVVKLVGEIWRVVGGGWWVVLSLLAQFLPGKMPCPKELN